MKKSKIKNQKSKLQFKNQNFGFCKVALIFAFCILNFIGCATVIEGVKGITGISTKALEDGRKDALKKTFNYDSNTCYGKAKEMFSHIGTYIYAKDAKKKMLAIYVSREDTTAVGIFFKEIDANHTQVEVSSRSTYAKELIAAKVFKSLSPEEKPVEADVRKN